MPARSFNSSFKFSLFRTILYIKLRTLSTYIRKQLEIAQLHEIFYSFTLLFYLFSVYLVWLM